MVSVVASLVQTLVSVAVIVAVGNGNTVTVALSVRVWLQLGVPDVLACVKFMVASAVSTPVVILPFPLASKVTVCAAPPFIV